MDRCGLRMPVTGNSADMFPASYAVSDAGN